MRLFSAFTLVKIITLALGLKTAGCGPATEGDKEIPLSSPPNPEDQTIPPNKVLEKFGPDKKTVFVVCAEEAKWRALGVTKQPAVKGCSILEMNHNLVIPPDAQEPIPFFGEARLARKNVLRSSKGLSPAEQAMLNPRLLGDSLNGLRRRGLPHPSGVRTRTGTWADQYARTNTITADRESVLGDKDGDGNGDETQVGFQWPFTATLNPANGEVCFAFKTSQDLPYFVIPVYPTVTATRATGMVPTSSTASFDIDGEVVVIADLVEAGARRVCFTQEDYQAGQERDVLVTGPEKPGRDIFGDTDNPTRLTMQLINQ